MNKYNVTVINTYETVTVPNYSGSRSQIILAPPAPQHYFGVQIFYIICSLPEHALPELLFHPQPGLEYEGDDGADLVFCVGMANNIGPRGSSK